MISAEDLIDALRLRLRFPIGLRTERPEQIGYVEACLSTQPDNPIVILPVGYWETQRHKALREHIFDDYFPTHVAEIGPIWSPATAIPFQLVLLSKTRPDAVHFAKFDPPATLPKIDFRNLGSFADLELQMQGAFDLLTIWSQGADSDGFDRPLDDVELDRLTVHFHDPDFASLYQNIESQPFARLGELVDVFVPRRTKQTGHVIRARDMREGTTSGTPDGPITNVPLRRGDVLVLNTGKFETFLVEDIDDGATAADHFIVLRCHDQGISPEYLVTYLNSDFAWAYSQRHTSGAVIQRLSKHDLIAMPVLIPEAAVLRQAEAVYRAVLDRKATADRLSQIADARFKVEELTDTSIQAYFMTSVADMISEQKAQYLKEIIDDDIREIDACRKAGALKACMVLSGSVLEAVLLEWVAELQGRKLTSLASSKLHDIINKLVEQGVLIDPKGENAHHIRKQRNIVHPMRMLKNEKLTETSVDEVLNMLKDIIHLRFS
ncbi:hypothetical protein GLP59_07150 [Sulfitobacter sp. M220]|jgi:hypothetical protein|uniref:hypothetical protein n=1 Tax=Sulfitobacter sp. M220 TaxID=2675333 RepID=UPI001F34EA6E|nr:hypothetical protein [Sulfitobacter sp. M220]MCF7777426.1 hypothetical protein [Sulfitobacter sp. M220]